MSCAATVGRSVPCDWILRPAVRSIHSSARGPSVGCSSGKPSDRLVDQDSGSPTKAGGLNLIAGMPAEVYITGEERTPLKYLLEPLLDVARRAARER